MGPARAAVKARGDKKSPQKAGGDKFWCCWCGSSGAVVTMLV